ncbi:MAG: chromosomal replication initiator protein DnaA [Myxococcales bacterium]|nr:chromosomal replication initiator protein DnaA [Myxococcales bacterium]
MQVLWKTTLESLREHISEETFQSLIRPIELASLEGKTALFRVPNTFHGEWVTANLGDVISDALCAAAEDLGREIPRPLEIAFEVDDSLMDRFEIEETPAEPAKPARASVAPSATPSAAPRLNAKYSFDNFIVGPSNQLAHAASVGVAKAPGSRMNPLVICGETGLGKTHLTNAIGRAIYEANPKARIIYLSAEEFTNEFLLALRNQRADEFHQRFRRECDVLLMDDIQFLAERERTQEVFFHTFNTLYQEGKQIVITSDVYPQHIPGMQERLVSRFEAGMVADVQPPELDTRVAILQKKAEEEGIDLDPAVADFLARVVKNNVRELEGILIRLAVKAELLGRRIDMELARDATRSLIVEANNTATTVEDIQKAVCAYFGIRLSDLKGKRRHRAVSFPRMVAMYLARQRLGTSFPELGDRFGGKDHTTVMNAVRKIDRLVEESDEQVVASIEAIERRLGF